MEDDLDLSQHFSPTYTVPEPSMTADAARDIDKLGMVGAASLDDKGYFTRIVTAQGMPVRRLMNPQNVRVLIVEDDDRGTHCRRWCRSARRDCCLELGQHLAR